MVRRVDGSSPSEGPLMRTHRRAQRTIGCVAHVTFVLVTLAGVSGCSHHTARQQQAPRPITFGLDGRIGPLRVDVSDRRDVISFLGRPDAERRARTAQEDFQANISYDALGYGCGANASADAMTLVHGGLRCRTVFVIDRHGRLEVLGRTPSFGSRSSSFERTWEERRGGDEGWFCAMDTT